MGQAELKSLSLQLLQIVLTLAFSWCATPKPTQLGLAKRMA